MFIDREELIQEEKLRIYIRKAMDIVVEQRTNTQRQHSVNERKLRQFVRKLIKEQTEAAPHASTGINVLEDLLKKIIPQIETE